MNSDLNMITLNLQILRDVIVENWFDKFFYFFIWFIIRLFDEIEKLLILNFFYNILKVAIVGNIRTK